MTIPVLLISLLAYCVICFLIWSYPCLIDFSHWFTCSFSQLLCESANSNLILRSQGLAHWKHSKILCWTYEWRTCYFARLYIAGLAMLGYVLSTLHWEAVLCSEKLLALQARKPGFPHRSAPFYLPFPGPCTILSHWQDGKNEQKNIFLTELLCGM